VPGGASFTPVRARDSSFLGRLKTESDVAGEQSVAAMADVPTLLAVLRAGSLLQRRAAARRLAERLADKELTSDDRRRIQETIEQLRDVEIAYELLACHGLLPGEAAREAQRARREVLELAARLERTIVDYWDRGSDDEPMMALSGDARAQLMLHARDLSDVVLWHVSALVEGSSGATDPATQRTLLAAVRYAADPRLVPALVALLEADDSRLVIETARAISRIEDARVWPALVAAYERSVIEGERIALGAALGRLGDVRAAVYVRAQLKSEDEHVAMRALEALRTVGTAEDVPAVVAILRGGDALLATKAAHTLGRISDGRALSELAKVAREAEIGSLRAAAEEAVHQIGSRLVLRGEEPRGESLPMIASGGPRDIVEAAPPALTIRLRALLRFVSGRFWQLVGAKERALRRFDDAAKCWPEWTMPLLVAAVMHAARDDFPQALTLFRRALARSRARIEHNPLLIREVARCFLRRAEEVERDVRIAIARGLLDEVLMLDLRRVPSSLRFEIGRRHELLRLAGGG